MPHLVVEYSANLDERIELPALIRHLHDAALATGVFPEKGIRTRAERRDLYRIADGHPDNAFIHLVLRIGHGRDVETRRRAGGDIFAALAKFVADDQAHHPLALSCEVQEAHPELAWKQNNLSEWMETRQGSRR